jgi:hypothetical protein
MDQPAHAGKQRLTVAPRSIGVTETSRAFFRDGIASLRRHLLHALWAGCTAIRYGTPFGLTHADAAILKRPGMGQSADHIAWHETSAKRQSLNSEPGCIKVVDTFRTVPLIRPPC